MSQLEDKLGTILSNPQIMQQIAAMAQTLGQSPQEQLAAKPQPSPSLPNPALLQNLSGMLQTGSIDPSQQELLRALSPFLSPTRLGKLERAMRAAKMAGFASVLLRSGGLNLFSGR